MKTTLVELVDVIIQRIQERPDAQPSEKGLRTWLLRQGYKKSDVDAALKLVQPRFADLAKGTEKVRNSVRLLSVHEEYKLSPDARNALARLDLYGLLDPLERETVLDQLAHYEGEVGIEDLDCLLAWLVCSSRDVEFQQTFYNVLEGKGDTLH